MEPFLAQIVIFAGNFAPRGWAFCDGQLLPIAQNSALFSLVGTIYGGDGRTTFALPDLRGRVAIGPRTGPGLPTYREGARGGSTTNTLNVTQLPSHSHTGTIKAQTAIGEENTPTGNYPSMLAQAYSEDMNTSMAGDAIQTNATGGGQAVNNMQPYLAINFIIALQGTFPSRS